MSNNTLWWIAGVGATGLGAMALERHLRQRNAIRGRIRAVEKADKLRPISRKFDPVFERYGNGLPLTYLRALAKRESNLDPDNTTGPAWGLMQVVEVVRRDFNKAHKTSYTRADLLKPEVNVSMATWLLNIIIRSYERNHPDVPNLQVDWDNPRFVELLTFGWNSGWSESRGLGRVARYLEQRGQRDITAELVHKHAAAAGGVRFLSERARMRWSKSVARYYLSERLHEMEAPRHNT